MQSGPNHTADPAVAATPSSDSAVVVVVANADVSAKDVQAVIPERSTLLSRIFAQAKTEDWCPVWAGLLCFLLLLPLVFATSSGASDERLKYLVPQPMPWLSNPIDAWDWYNGVFTWVLLAALLATYLGCARAMGKLKKTLEELRKTSPEATLHDVTIRYVVGFVIVSLLALACLWLGRQKQLSDYGISYAVYAIGLGMIVGNGAKCCSPRLCAAVETWLQPVAKDGEFMIKVALVLYAKSFKVIGDVGLQGLLVAWIGSPLAVVAGWFIGVHALKMENRPQVMLLSVGAAWCGASAMAAVQPIVGATSEDLTLCVSLVVLFTQVLQFAQPYFALAVGLSDSVAGAWIGASVDQTGNVVVSAAIMSEDAAETAGVVKMILNAGLGLVCLVVATVWPKSTPTSETSDKAPGSSSSSKLWLLWTKFPKFVLGFLCMSLVLTLMEIPLEGTEAGAALPRAISSVSKWWMCVAFLSIGISTDCRKLLKQVQSGGAIILYLVTNGIDMALALGLSALCFGVWRRA
jgi:uncharacterized integral membrane protein (TIGR00698 family)